MKMPWKNDKDQSGDDEGDGFDEEEWQPVPADHGKMTVTSMLNAFCLDPTEIASFRVIYEEGVVTGTNQNDSTPGVVLTLGLTRSVPGMLIPIDVPIALTRETVAAVHEAFGKYLSDGGHYHWYTTEEVKRMADQPAVGLSDMDMKMDIPDTMEGLGE